jgi:competence protein ComEA
MKRFIALVIAWLASIGVAFAAVNVNTASKQELEALKEIGPVKAQAIIDYRNQHGPFRSLDDLDKVKGIGKATIAAIRDDVTFSGPNTGIAPMKRDNRAEDRTDARAQRGDSMTAPERVTRREEKREGKRDAREEKRDARDQKQAAREDKREEKKEDKRRVATNESRGVLDINTASEKELRDLPGVGAARAKAIVKGRPYRSKDELVSKHILPESTYAGVKDRIVAHRVGG